MAKKSAPAIVICVSVLAIGGNASAQVSVHIDNGTPHQTMEGFGATTISLAYGATDNVRPDLRPLAIDAAYNQVHLNMGNLEPEPSESPTSNVFAPANDDNDPMHFNQSGFNWIQSDNLVNKVVMPASAFGFDNFWIGPVVNTGYALGWTSSLLTSNYQLYLDEIAEHVAAVAIHWRDAYGLTPRYMQLFNEPLSGNHELSGGSPTTLVDIVKRAGARLRTEGISSMQFVVPAEETELVSLSHAQTILSDSVARPFVGAIAYHPYPYGSAYASVPNILRASGSGVPDAASVDARHRLRDLGQTYGVPVFMIEVSHGEVPYDSFDGLRGRAIQIHDELEYADAAAFFGMNALWDSTSQMQHFAGRTDPGLFSETDTIVLIDNDAGRVYITCMGHAIGHYARFIHRGAVRLDVSTNDPLVLISAFRDDASGNLAFVAINNSTSARTLNVDLSGIAITGNIHGEQSTATTVWEAITPSTPRSAGQFDLSIPAMSVTSFAATITGSVIPDAGVVTPDVISPMNDAALTDVAVARDATVPPSDATVSDSTVARDGSNQGETAVNPDGRGPDAGRATSPQGCGCRSLPGRDASSSWAFLWTACAMLTLVRLRRAARSGTHEPSS